MSRRLLAVALVLLASAAPATAILNNPIKLQDIIDKLPSIFLAEVDAVDADNATAVFVPKDDLKGKTDFTRLPVNLKDGVTAPAKQADHTKVILERLAKGRKLILFVKKDGDNYSAWGFVEGTWFQLAGTTDKDDKKTVRWAFLNCEPALRGTFKGTTEELRALVADVVAGKAKAPAPDAKEKPGFGPTVEEEKKPKGEEKKEVNTPHPPGSLRSHGDLPHKGGGGQNTSPLVGEVGSGHGVTEPGGGYFGGPLFGVIPSTVFVAPLAVLAAIFPATFGGLASGFRRWRAFMTVVSVNGMLAAVYFFTQKLLPDQWWASPTAFTALLLGVVALGLLWSGRRYRSAVAADPAETDPPAWKDVFVLLGFAAASVLIVFAVVFVGEWILTKKLFGTPFKEVAALLFQLPTRELTAGIVGLLAGAGYLAYRCLRRPSEPDPSVRTRLAGETVALMAMLLFGGVMLTLGLPRTGTTGTAAVELGDTAVSESESPIKLTDGTIWFESPDVEEIDSGITLTPTHAYFGGLKDATFRKGAIVCIDRATGKQQWVYSDNELRTVYCTPVVADGRVYCGEGLHTDPLCRLLCLDAATGQKLWEFRTQSHTEGTPVVADGRVYFAAGDDGVYCLSTEVPPGAMPVVLWHYHGREQGLHVDTPVVLADGKVYAGSGYNTYAAFCLDGATGAEVWKKELPYRSFGNPLVSGDRVFFGVGTGRLTEDLNPEVEQGHPPELKPAGAVLCLNAATGDTVWQHDLDRAAHTQLSADGRTVFAACRDGWLYALDRGTGKRRWRFDYGTPLTTGTAVASYTKAKLALAVYSAHPAGRVQAHDPLTGKVFWARAVDQFSNNRGVEILAPPTVDKSDGWGTREVFVPVTLKNKNNTDTRAAVVRFVDKLVE